MLRAVIAVVACAQVWFARADPCRAAPLRAAVRCLLALQQEDWGESGRETSSEGVCVFSCGEWRPQSGSLGRGVVSERGDAPAVGWQFQFCGSFLQALQACIFHEVVAGS
jgi:hypothetical protein